MITVYGIRLRGDIEARYIGFTRYETWRRLTSHFGEALSQTRKSPVCVWLLENRPNIEIFEITTVETVAEARAKEREIVAICLALNHRLLNHHLVPADRRVPEQAEAA
jgi:hypothetical protein